MGSNAMPPATGVPWSDTVASVPNGLATSDRSSVNRTGNVTSQAQRDSVEENQILPRAAPPSGFPVRVHSLGNQQSSLSSVTGSPQEQPALRSADSSMWQNAPQTTESSEARHTNPQVPQVQAQPQFDSAYNSRSQNGFVAGQPPYGGYVGPQLVNRGEASSQYQVSGSPQQPGSSTDDDTEDLIRRFADAIHSAPAVPNGTAQQVSGPLPDPVLRAMDKDLYRIKLLVENKRTLVSHLNQMCKTLRLGTHGLKKEKQERLLALAQRLRSRGDAAALSNMRRVVDAECPPDLRPAEGSATGGPSLQFSSPQSHASSNRGRRTNASSGTPAALHNGIINSARNASYSGFGSYSTGQNPLAASSQRPVVQLSFRMSPFYHLGQSIRPPVVFMKPYARRRVSQMIAFDCDPKILAQADSHVYLVCQEYIPSAGNQQPIYFPFYNELELDDEVLTANTRGIRGVAGSARPVDLKPTILKRANRRHKLRITVVVNDQGERVSDKSFAFGIYYGYKVPHESLVDQIKARPHIELNATKSMAMQAARSDEGDDIVMGADAVYSLNDKVMMTRIAVPIRSRACTHIECFDALTFIMLQDQAETWKCPICNRVITWESLAVDNFFSEILENAGPEVESVAINADGSWSVEATDSLDEDDSDSDSERKPVIKRSRSELESEVVELLSETDDEGPDQQVQSRGKQALQDNRAAQIEGELPPSAPTSQSRSAALNAPSRAPADESLSNADNTNSLMNSSVRGNSPLSSNEASPATPDIARHEIYATIRAFQKSNNLMFDAPLKVAEHYSTPRIPAGNGQPYPATLSGPGVHENNSRISDESEHPTPPFQSPLVRSPSGVAEATENHQPMNGYIHQAVQPLSSNQPMTFRLPALSRLVDDGDDDDDVIDLTGDD